MKTDLVPASVTPKSKDLANDIKRETRFPIYLIIENALIDYKKKMVKK
jgi:hypothetical protein